MKRDMTNYEIIQVINKLDSLSGNIYHFQIARAISKTLKALREEYKIYEESYRDLIKEYFETDDNGMVRKSEDGKDILIDPEKREEAYEKIANLCNETVSDIEITQFDETVLEKAGDMSPRDFTFFEEYLIKQD